MQWKEDLSVWWARIPYPAPCHPPFSSSSPFRRAHIPPLLPFSAQSVFDLLSAAPGIDKGSDETLLKKTRRCNNCIGSFCYRVWFFFMALPLAEPLLEPNKYANTPKQIGNGNKYQIWLLLNFPSWCDVSLKAGLRLWGRRDVSSIRERSMDQSRNRDFFVHWSDHIRTLIFDQNVFTSNSQTSTRVRQNIKQWWKPAHFNRGYVGAARTFEGWKGGNKALRSHIWPRWGLMRSEGQVGINTLVFLKGRIIAARPDYYTSPNQGVCVKRTHRVWAA